MPIYKKIEEPKNFISSNLKYLMFLHDIKSSQLQIYIGEHHATISNWRCGVAVPKISKIQKLCTFFEVNMNEFVESDMSPINETLTSDVEKVAES